MVLANLREAEVSKTLFEFRPSRSRDGPNDFLGDWSGTLIIDGYSGYNEVASRNGIVRAACWEHGRRKLKKALDVGTRAAAEVSRRCSVSSGSNARSSSAPSATVSRAMRSWR